MSRASAAGLVLAAATAAPAQEVKTLSPASLDEPHCKWPEVPSHHYCCPPDTTFRGNDCVPNTSEAASASPNAASGPAPAAAEAPKVTGKSAPGEPPVPPKAQFLEIFPALLCGDDVCKNARVSVDGEAQAAPSAALLKFETHRDRVRVDVHAPGYEDYTTYVTSSSEGVLTLRATLDPVKNVTVGIDACSRVDPFATVYVQDPVSDVVVGQCAIDVAQGTGPTCAMTVPQRLLGGHVNLRVAGNVILHVDHVALCKAPQSTDIQVDVHAPPQTWWYWPAAGALTAATIGVLIGGSQTNGTAGDILMVTGAGLTAGDLIGGGWLIAHDLAPHTDATVSVTGCTSDRLRNAATYTVPATLASAPRRTPVTEALSPTGLGFTW